MYIIGERMMTHHDSTAVYIGNINALRMHCYFFSRERYGYVIKDAMQIIKIKPTVSVKKRIVQCYF